MKERPTRARPLPRRAAQKKTRLRTSRPARFDAVMQDLLDLVEALAERDERPAGEILEELLPAARARWLGPTSAGEARRRWRTLSRREREVVYRFCNGYPMRIIAAELYITPNTAKTHLRNAMRKFHLRDRRAFRLVLERWGIIRLDDPETDDDAPAGHFP